MEILLSIDVGSSQTKVIYQVRKKRVNGFFVMPPEVEEVPQSRLDDFMERRGWIGVPSPEKESWVVWKNRTVVVGDFASFFDPQDRIKEVKYENALWKILCAIGVIVEKTGIKIRDQKPLTLKLGLLLPWNEYSDRQRMHELLEVMLSEFQFRSTVLRVKLESFVCRPEGGGLAAARIKNLDVDDFCNKKVGVLMLGHRNTTALYFEQGRLELGDSPLLGFSSMLDRVIEMTSGLSRERLVKGIFQARDQSIGQIYNPNYKNTRHPEWSECDGIKALANARDPELKAKEIGDIGKAISTATIEYWQKLERWISSVFDDQMDEVIIGGGAAYHIEPELEVYFNCRPVFDTDTSLYIQTRVKNQYSQLNMKKPAIPMVWGALVEESLIKHFQLEGGDTDFMASRLLDCFGLFDYLLGRKS